MEEQESELVVSRPIAQIAGKREMRNQEATPQERPSMARRIDEENQFRTIND